MKRIILFVLLALMAFGAIFGFSFYQKIYAPNVPQQLENPFLQIPSGSDYEQLKSILKKDGFILEESSFDWVADKMSYKQGNIRAGRFELQPGMSNRKLIQQLRSGKQSPVKLVLVNERLPEDVAGKASKFIEADSLSILKLLTSPTFLQKYDLNLDNAMSLFIPNTYEFYWNTSAEQFIDKMEKENQKFWTEARLAKAKAMKRSPQDIYTVASIVERETNQNGEKKRIAGVYLNRLKKGMKLEADPTVVFAMKEFGLRRILKKHLEFDSPYNTYKYAGLPPGPISMASITSIDAVLNAEDHKYIFFCAKPDGSGFHSFARNYAGHLANARKYHAYLRTIGRKPNKKD